MNDRPRMARPAAYEKVRDEIVGMIRGGALHPGDRLPSEKELAARFELNHQTIRRGLADLADLKIIERKVGSGSFVRVNKEELDRLLARPPAEDIPLAAAAVPMMGVLCLTEYDAFATELLGHLHRLSADRGLQILIRVVPDFGESALATVRQMAGHGCRAVIVPWTRQGESAEALWALKKAAPVPVVTPDIYGKTQAADLEPGWIDLLRLELVYRYLREIGRENIAFFGPYEAGNLTVSRRLFAYTRLANESGLQTHIRLVKPSADEVLQCLDQWAPLADAEGGLAVICYDDDCALRLLSGAHKRGRRIPAEIAIVGFNNIAMGRMADPPLTSLEFGYDRLALDLVEHAMAGIERRPVATPPVFSERLVVRESCGGRNRFGAEAQTVADRIAGEVAKKHGVAADAPASADASPPASPPAP